MTKLNQHDHFVLWWLAYRLPVDHEVDEAAVLEACARYRYPVERALTLIKDHPKAWARMLEKRTARITGEPYPNYRPNKVAGARLADLKAQHKQKLQRMRRSGMPI